MSRQEGVIRRFTRQATLAAFALLIAAAPARALVISELMAVNNTTIADEDGDFSDWLEIYNDGVAAANLGGWYLTDDATALAKWQLPAVSVPAGGYLLVWASDKDRAVAGQPLHLNFKLSGGGEYLALIRSDAFTIEHEYSPGFPEQDDDVSYGLASDLVTERCFLDPTPGTVNNETLGCGVADEVDFAPGRGFHDAPFSVALSTVTAGADIRYTTDGSWPSTTDGQQNMWQFAICSTTTVRAVAILPGLGISNVVTHTYIFVDDVVQQSAAGLPAAYPDNWGGGTGGDYDMDPEIVSHPIYSTTIRDDLKAIRTLSITMEVDDLFGASNGIYIHPQGRGIEWERAASVELLSPDGSEDGFGVNCGIRIQGGVSRFSGTKKHSLRLLFKGIYGPTKLDYPLFDGSPVERFDTLTLTAGHNNAWIGGYAKSQYLRDTWTKDTQLAMGQPGSHSTYVHLYLNGIYWGLYRPTERPDGSFMAEHLGGDKDEYDALNSGKLNDGNKDAWDTAQALAKAGVSTTAAYDAVREYVDVDNLIDYMLVNAYSGNYDWDFHNWRAARRRVPGAGWKFFSWDAELIWNTVNSNKTSVGNFDAPSAFYDHLRRDNSEFRVLYGDHAHRHFFNGGVLTTESVIERFMKRSTEIDRAIVGESARWGDKLKSTPFARDEHWLIERQRLLLSYFPQRSAIVLDQLRSKDLYPAHVAPVFNQHGGDFDAGFALEMSAPAGIVYYTDDGSDPRLPGGAVSPFAQVYTVPIPLLTNVDIHARARVGTGWSALNAAGFVRATPLRVSELMFHPVPDAELEYIELVNVGADPIDLGGLALTDGVDFVFPSTILAPGAHVLVVEDVATFEAIHGAGLPVAGAYSGRLSNGGERIVLTDAEGGVIQDFTYDDVWYADADGAGNSLVVRDLAADKSEWDLASAWRASTFIPGSPGADELPLCADGVDNDDDGLTDHPADPGCASAAQDIEDPECSDGIDNDEDGDADLADGDCVGATGATESGPPVNPFLCYQARTTSGTPRFERLDVNLADAVEGSGPFTVRKPKQICVPAAAAGEPLVDAATYLEAYDVRVAEGGPPRVELENLRFEDAFGPIFIDTSRTERLLVPTSLDAGATTVPPDNQAHDVDHYKCYRSRISSSSALRPKYFPRNAQDHAADAFEDRDYRLKPPKQVCVPVDMNGNGIKTADRYLLCYQAKVAKFSPKHVPRVGLHTANALGNEQLDTRKEESLCVPARLGSGF